MYVFHNALNMSALSGESKPLTFYNVLRTGSAWRFHVCSLRDRAAPISPNVLLSPLRCAPRQVYRSDWGGGPPGEAMLSCGDSGTYGFLLRRVSRSADPTDLVKKGLSIHLSVHLM